VLVNVATSPPMSPAGALASPRFFSHFDAGGTHAGWLTPAELKLISNGWKLVHSISMTHLPRLRPDHTRGASLGLSRTSQRTGTVIGRIRMTAFLLRTALVLAALAFGLPADAKYQPEVVVSDPYIDLHTGPGRVIQSSMWRRRATASRS
jgi:hypothetical protein